MKKEDDLLNILGEFTRKLKNLEFYLNFLPKSNGSTEIFEKLYSELNRYIMVAISKKTTEAMLQSSIGLWKDNFPIEILSDPFLPLEYQAKIFHDLLMRVKSLSLGRLESLYMTLSVIWALTLRDYIMQKFTADKDYVESIRENLKKCMERKDDMSVIYATILALFNLYNSGYRFGEDTLQDMGSMEKEILNILGRTSQEMQRFSTYGDYT